jgi:branched-chain amino acid transport system permease protein
MTPRTGGLSALARPLDLGLRRRRGRRPDPPAVTRRITAGWVAPAALLALAALVPLVVDAGGDLLNDMVLAAAYIVMALGLNVVVGFAGLTDLGYVAFYAIGAYTAAYLASGFWAGANDGHGVAVLAGALGSELPGIHVNFLVVIVVAAAATALAGAAIGIPTLRLRGDYIAIVTLAFGEIIGRVAANGSDIALLGGTLTAGPNNIGPIDKIDLPLLAPFDAVNVRPWYWFALALVAVALLITIRLRDSRLGRAWIAVRDDEDAAAVAGIPIARTKLLAYATGAALGGMAGAFLASYLAIVNASQFQFSFSIFVFTMVVVGGLGSIPGAVAGAIVMSAINSWLLPDVLSSLPRTAGLGFDLEAVESGIYGLILLVVMLLRPQGLVPAR